MGTVANIVVGRSTLSIDGTDVGFTTGGVQVRFVSNLLEIEADQLAGVAAIHVIDERMYLRTTLLEATITNLRIALMQPTSHAVGGSALFYGSGAPTVQEHVLTLAGKGPDQVDRTWTFYRAVPMNDEFEQSVGQRDAPSQIPISFQCLKDPLNGDRFAYSTDA